MRARCPSTVRSERKSAAATSRFVLPSATSAATRSSAGVSAPGVAARPLMRFSSARARSAQSAAPMRSKASSASSSVARASRRRFARRCAAPRASDDRACSKTSRRRRAASTERSSSSSAPSRSPLAATSHAASAAGRRRSRARGRVARRSLHVAVEERCARPRAPRSEQRLDQVGQERQRARLAGSPRAGGGRREAAAWSTAAAGSPRTEREVAERPGREDPGGDAARLPRERQRALAPTPLALARPGRGGPAATARTASV